MGILGDTIREVMDKGLRTMNAEINQDAIDKGLVTPKTADMERGSNTAHCRAGFEKLHATLTADRH